ncbi:hypothetical protein O1611_g2866 [Lasiodiplodia mahajangana]|uniref:Uncharacterized protein n=1 Tax=Lasiodiplodia mahajangana TaxID=1108764 RepID=A0ACC2JTC2_9PEZI|nr:hypothetical protein O1611_g2866 [Lasiodiplodia mahajangana]
MSTQQQPQPPRGDEFQINDSTQKPQKHLVEEAAETPSLVWLKFGREVHVEKFEDYSATPIPDLLRVQPEKENKELNENPVVITQPPFNDASRFFRASSAIRRNLIAKVKQLSLKNSDEDTSKKSPTSTRGIQFAEPKIRNDHDWLILEGYVVTWVAHARGDLSRFPLYQPISDVRTCVLRLLDLARGIKWVTCKQTGFGSDLAIEIPQHGVQQAIYHYQMNHILGQLVSYDSKCENLKILVGKVPEDVKPSDLEELGSTLPANAVSLVDGLNMKIVRLVLEDWRQLHHKWVYGFLESDEGLQIRNFSRFPKEFCHWLGTSTGKRWLHKTSEGRIWLRTEHGLQWLVWSDNGLNYLESAEGVKWLSSSWADPFLASKYAKHWAQLGKTPTGEGGPDTAQSKAWYSTAAGHEWYCENCPHGMAPKSMLQEPQWKSRAAEEKPTKYEFGAHFELDPRPDRLSDLFIHIPEKISFVRYRGGYKLRGPFDC